EEAPPADRGVGAFVVRHAARCEGEGCERKYGHGRAMKTTRQHLSLLVPKNIRPASSPTVRSGRICVFGRPGESAPPCGGTMFRPRGGCAGGGVALRSIHAERRECRVVQRPAGGERSARRGARDRLA